MTQTIKTQVALIAQSLARVKKDVEGLVTFKEFAPVQKIVYGFVGLILVAVGSAIIGLVVMGVK